MTPETGSTAPNSRTSAAPRWLTALAWSSALGALLLWVATTLIAERTLLTLLLSYFLLPQFWLLPALLVLLVSLRWRAGRAVLGSRLAVGLNLSLLGWHGRGAAGGASDFRLMTSNVARGRARRRHWRAPSWRSART